MTANSVRLEIPNVFRTLCLWSAVICLTTTLSSAWLYLLTHPGFSPVNTYLSEIGGAGGWPAAVFNAGLLIVAPLRFLVAVLLTLRLRELGLSHVVARTIVGIAFFTAFGTVLMTAVPFNVGPAAHKLGILLYFLGTVIVMSIIATVEFRLRVARLLPVLSAGLVVVYAVFATALVLWGAGVLPRTAPVPLEWMCFTASILWVIAHGIVLGSRNSLTPAPRGNA